MPTKILRQKSILVVDDDAAMLRALEKVLRQAGCLVTRAQAGDEALEQLGDRAKRFDLVITDLCMPLVNGMTILHAVQTVFPELPVMIITAYAGPNTKVEFLQQGAAAFLEKPLDAPKLLEEIARVLAAGKTKGTNHEANKNQIFSIAAPTAVNVLLAGDFTHWQDRPIPMKKQSGGLWQVTIELPPGRHHYRFIVDGEWRDDPECTLYESNSWGGQNAVRDVR